MHDAGNQFFFWILFKIVLSTHRATDLVWSFAYGANMNRSSLAKRHVTPRQSLPAILHDVRRLFFPADHTTIELCLRVVE